MEGKGIFVASRTEPAWNLAEQLGCEHEAPAGPFDAATCLLTMHIVAIADSTRTLNEIRGRLKPGAPFVLAHLSFPQARR